MKKIYNNIINLCTTYQIEESTNRLDILYLQLKIWKNKLNYLEENKPFNFQKRKMIKYNQEKAEIKSYIEKFQKIINVELNSMGKLLDNYNKND